MSDSAYGLYSGLKVNDEFLEYTMIVSCDLCSFFSVL